LIKLSLHRLKDATKVVEVAWLEHGWRVAFAGKMDGKLRTELVMHELCLRNPAGELLAEDVNALATEFESHDVLQIADVSSCQIVMIMQENLPWVRCGQGVGIY
jgi:hypothetical protein